MSFVWAVHRRGEIRAVARFDAMRSTPCVSLVETVLHYIALHCCFLFWSPLLSFGLVFR